MKQKQRIVQISIDKRCSIYAAEAVAIEKAIGVVQEMKIERDVLILTDSQSVIKAIMNNNIKRYQNRYIWKIKEKIYNIIREAWKRDGTKRKIVIGWIPGYKGIAGNEIADRIAKEGTKDNRDERIKVPLNDWSRMYKEEMEKRTKDRVMVESKSKGMKYFEKYYRVENKKV